MNANAPHDAIDSTIDRALSALRDAQPRSGLEGRILASLEHRTATYATNPGGLPFHSFIVKGWGIVRGSERGTVSRATHLALWAATSAAIIAVASMLILHHHAIPATNGSLATAHPTENAVILSGARSAQSKDPETARHATNPKPFPTTNLAQTSMEPTHRAAHHSTMPAACAQPGCAIHDGDAPGSPASSARWGGSPSAVMDGVSQTPTEAQAFADLHAPSHPAPPSSLTQQEKLLLHMLRYGNATQLAELNPAVRAQHDADETTAFKAFFPDPPPVQQPGDNE